MFAIFSFLTWIFMATYQSYRSTFAIDYLMRNYLKFWALQQVSYPLKSKYTLASINNYEYSGVFGISVLNSS